MRTAREFYPMIEACHDVDEVYDVVDEITVHANGAMPDAERLKLQACALEKRDQLRRAHMAAVGTIEREDLESPRFFEPPPILLGEGGTYKHCPEIRQGNRSRMRRLVSLAAVAAVAIYYAGVFWGWWW